MAAESSGALRVGSLARAFLAAAMHALEEQRVVPPPEFHPHIHVGRDYFGPDLMPLASFQALEAAIEETYPRFHEDVPLHERDFANAYIFSLLERFVLQRFRHPYSPTDFETAANLSIGEFTSALGATEFEVAACRLVSHLTTIDGNPVAVAGVTVHPVNVPAHDHSRGVHELMEAAIPGCGAAYGREPPVTYFPPESVVVALASAADPFEAAREASGRIERFLLLIRLLSCSTSESLFEVQGETSSVRRLTPHLIRFRGPGGWVASTRMVRRTARVEAADERRLEGLWRLLDEAESGRPGMAVTSFGMAMHKFQGSYHSTTWFEQLVDLATAFEAAISGTDTTDVVLRLRIRAATLLATQEDTAEAIFGDVGLLYRLRSTLVHGGELTEKTLVKIIRGVSSVPSDSPFGVAVGYAVDRLRDLVRRALLARICLAVGNEPQWPLGGDKGVDAALADDRQRVDWRHAWHEALASFDAAGAAGPPRSAVDFISTEDSQ